MRKNAKTKEVKVIQGRYDSYWEDVSIYDRDEYKNIRHDLAEYRASHTYSQVAYRVITRRVPVDE